MRNKLIRILALSAIALLISVPIVSAQARTTNQVFSATGAGTSENIWGTGIYNHRLTWTGKGTRTTCTIKLEQSVDGTTWTDLITSQTCTTNGSVTATGLANYVRFNLTALTGTGNTLSARYEGTVDFITQKVVTLTWTAAANGTVTNQAVSSADVSGWFLFLVVTNPGATAPTDNYDCTLLDDDSVDTMGGSLADRDTANTEQAMPLIASIPVPRPINGGLTLTVSNNSVNAATGTVKLYFVR